MNKIVKITKIEPLNSADNKWRAEFAITSGFDDWGMLTLSLMNEIKAVNSDITIDTAGVVFEGNNIYKCYVDFYSDEDIAVPVEG